MITNKPLHQPTFNRIWTVVNSKRTIPAIAFTVVAALVLPGVSSFISHQIRSEAAGGTSCLRVSADRKSQVRKYGTDCNL